MVKRRQNQVPDLQTQLSTDAARQAHLQAQQQRQQQQYQQQQQMIMSQMAARGLGQHGFQPLQNPNQVPVMPQQPQQMGMGMSAQTMLQNRPEQRQFPMQMGQPRQPGILPANEMNQLNPQDKARLDGQAMKLLSQTGDIQKHQIRQMVQQKLGPAAVSEYTAAGRDIAFIYFQGVAFQQLYGRPPAQRTMMQQRPGMPQAPHMGQMNPGFMNSLGQQQAIPDGQMFAPNMESIRNEQAMGLLAQQAGQMVVPASTAPGRNATPGAMAGQPPQPNAGNQQGPNQTARPPQVQQPFGMPQVKMDPAAAQAQGQPGARPAGRTMQGQPGTVATSNAPSQPSMSPALNALNTPMRQPPVPMGQGNGQPPMGATLNPQFSHQNNARPPSLQGNMNNQGMAGMVQNLTPEARAALASGADNGAMRELILKWDGRNGFPGAKQGQALGIPGQLQGRPMNGPNQTAMFGANQKGNGMMPPAAQPAPMQQQMSAERAKFMAWAQSPPGQASMNSMDIPPAILNQLQGSLPPNVQKWAQLKQFCQSNPGIIPLAAQNQLHNFQVQQFKTMWEKKKPQQQNQPPPLPPGVQYPPNISQVAQPEFNAFRQSQPRLQNMPDEAMIELMGKVKRDNFAKRAWSMYNQQLQGQGNNGAGAGAQNSATPVPPTPTTQLGGITPTPQPNARQGQQHVGQPKPTGAPTADVVPTPASGTLKNARAQQNRQTPMNPSPAPSSKNLKRANPDDADDTHSQPINTVQRPPSQSDARPPTGAPKPSMEQLMKLSPEQLAKISPEQLANIPPEQRAMIMGRQQQIASEEILRLKQFATEEQRVAQHEMSQEKEIPMSPAELQEMRVKLAKAVERINKLRGPFMPKWYRVTRDEGRARMFFRTVCINPSHKAGKVC